MVEESDWWERQLLSVERYRSQHEARQIEEQILAVYRLFGAYLRAVAFEQGLDRPRILDVGCGIFLELSPAMEGITNHCDYLGLDPLPYNKNRDYPFICSTLENFSENSDFHNQFDLFVFGTSLDHLEDLATAANAVRRLSAPNARVVFWNGLHDPALVASDSGARLFSRITTMPSSLGFVAYLGYGFTRLPRLLFRMHQRRRKLRHSIALDHHSRWFTQTNLRDKLSVFGQVTDILNLPNTNHSFATVLVLPRDSNGIDS